MRKKGPNQYAVVGTAAVLAITAAGALASRVASNKSPIQGDAALEQVETDMRATIDALGLPIAQEDFNPFPGLHAPRTPADFLKAMAYEASVLTGGEHATAAGGFAPPQHGMPAYLSGARGTYLQEISELAGLTPAETALLISGHELGHLYAFHTKVLERMGRLNTNDAETYGDVAVTYMMLATVGPERTVEIMQKWSDNVRSRDLIDPCHDSRPTLNPLLKRISSGEIQQPANLAEAYQRAETYYERHGNSTAQASARARCTTTVPGAGGHSH